MILDLLPEGHPFLKQAVPDFDITRLADMARLATDLTETMFHHRALGLSANQVGLGERVFVMHMNGSVMVCFNPTIELMGEEQTLHEEGCLSFPGLSLKVKRPSAVFLEWSDEVGGRRREMLVGYDAYVAQHELDHLNGLTFDRLASRLVLDMAKKKRLKR